jgi:hypothetical protein
MKNSPQCISYFYQAEGDVSNCKLKKSVLENGEENNNTYGLFKQLNLVINGEAVSIDSTTAVTKTAIPKKISQRIKSLWALRHYST